MPSMKLVRLTNHRHASSSSARSIHHGSIGTTRKLGRKACDHDADGERLQQQAAARPRCVRRSSARLRPAAMNAVAANTRPSDAGSNDGSSRIARAPAATAIVAAMTAMPPPCGVDLRCDERALGWASAIALQQRQQREDDAGADGGRERRRSERAQHCSSVRCRNRLRAFSSARLISRDGDRDQPSAGRSPRPRSARRRAGAPLRHNGRATPATRPRSRSRRPGPADRRHGTSRPVSPGCTISRHPGNVGGDHRPAAGRGLEQAFRQALAPRWQHRDMGARPERRNVVDMTEPGDAGLPAPACGLLFAHRCRVGRVGRARDQQFDIRAALAQQPVGADQRANALVGEQPADEGDGRRAWRLGHAAAALRRRRPSPGSARCVRRRCRARACRRGRRGFAPARTASGRLSSRRSSALR